MNAFVTGASGFIGSHLTRKLIALGHRVVTAGRLPGAELFDTHRITHVFHLAAAGVRAGSATPEETIQVNTSAPAALARMAPRLERFLYVGSAFDYQDQAAPVDESAPLGGNTLYGASKAAGWLLLDYMHREEGLPLTTIRPFTVYGPGEHPEKFVPFVSLAALRRKPIQLTPGLQVRDYIYIDDVVDAIILAATSANAIGRVYNVGCGPEQARSIRYIAERIVTLAGAPRWLCEFGAAERARRDPAYLVADTTRARTELNWRPRVTLDQGLARTLDSFASPALQMDRGADDRLLSSTSSPALQMYPAA